MRRTVFKKALYTMLYCALFSFPAFSAGFLKMGTLVENKTSGLLYTHNLSNNGIFMQYQALGKPDKKILIQGHVLDSSTNKGLAGVSVEESGTKNGTTTDANGNFSLQADERGVLSFSSLGYISKTVKVSDYTPDATGVIDIKVLLVNSTDHQLEEIVIVGFGTQKKASVVSSITTVSPKELKGPTSNLTQMFAGRIPGMISFQRSGEPGLDNSQFFIRGLSTFGSGKRDPLILIDGVESSATDLARLQPDDLADFSVLKDASAAAVYGARGANGVLLINTKEGVAGKTKFFFRGENRLSTNTENFGMTDNITYMKQANEAAITRNPLGLQPYSQNKIAHTMAGDDPYLYPNNNWVDQLLKKYTLNQAYNLNLSGGTRQFQYYISGTYNIDNGGLNVEPINDFNNNIKLKNYSLRAKVNLQITKSTNLMVNVYGQFDDYNGPVGGGAQAYKNIISSNPVAFPAVYPATLLPYMNHPLFGSAQVQTSDGVATNLYLNPFAELVKGFQVYKNSTIQPQIQLKQDFGFITKGLSFRGMGYLRRYAHYALNRSYIPFYYDALIDPETHAYQLRALNDGGPNSIDPTGREFLDYVQDGKDINSTFWLEGALSYNRIFSKHEVGGSLISYISDFESGNAGTLIASLPQRNQGVSGRFTYAYDRRYYFEFDFGYNGSERFASNHRYGFFPSFGVGYRISEEKFFKDHVHFVDNLKLRATYGLVGNDQIGSVDERFFYLSNVNLNDAGYGASFGKNTGVAPYSRNGVSISRYQNNNIGWEISKSLNLGLDLTLFHNLDITVDVYRQIRTNILQPKSNIESAAGFSVIPSSNYGKATSQGIDLAMDYKRNFNKKFWMTGRATMTLATSKVNLIDEIDYPAGLSYLSARDHSISQAWGLIAERLFVDQNEVNNAPVQFSNANLLGGDIKYKDVNKDGVVNADDMVPIGYPAQPEIIYGFGASFGWGEFDFSFFFQGSARSSFFIDAEAISPFNINGGYQNGLLKVIADDHWSEDNQNLYAFWPRYSGARIESNNVQRSTWWMRNGDFLRLKTVELGYTIPSFKVLKQKISKPRIYVSGQNLGLWSSFKLWDVEMGGNGLGYPIQSVYNLGFEINF
jgi:TonB-linked SusC/RagA family outer membrane protein